MRAYHLCVALGLMGILASCSSSSDKDQQESIQTAEIISFTANPDEVLEGDPSILSWEVRNAANVRIKDQQGKVLVTSEAKEGTLTVNPDRATQYALVARGKNGKEIEKQVAVRIRPGAGPEASFEIEPPVVPIGSPVRLVWETTDATEVVIRSGEKVVFESNRKLSGSIELVAEGPAIYTLTAVGKWGHRVVPAEVKVTPVILSFDAGKGEPVKKGSQAGVSWRTRGAHELTIRTPEGQSWNIDEDKVEAGSLVLPVGESGRFELIASRGEHKETQNVDVPILGAPTIRSLTVSQRTITDAEATPLTVSWEVDNGHEGELVWGDDNRRRIGWLELREGSYDLELAEVTDITLVARNEVASASSTVRVSTIPAPKPILSGPIHVGPGEEFVLGWSAVGAERIKLFRNDEELDIAEDQIAGTITESVTQRTTYRLEAWNELGSLRTGSRAVSLASPQVVALKSDRVRYGSGAPMVLSWSTTGGTALQIFDEEGEPLPGCSLEEGGGIEGSCTIPAPIEFGTYTYVLEAANGIGRATRTLTFRVDDGPAIDRFEADGEFVTLGADVTLRWLVLDDVDGVVPDITIADNKGGRWNFRGTHLEEGRLVLPATETGPWIFDLTASVPGKEPVHATTQVVAVAAPTVSLTASSLVFSLDTMEPLTLNWTATYAETIQIFGTYANGASMTTPLFTLTGQGDSSAGSLEVVPEGKGQGYRIIATNAAGDQATDILFTETTGLTGPIIKFDVTETTVARGASVTVDWNVWGFDVSGTTLSPFLDDAPRELTDAPIINISSSGTAVSTIKCHGKSWDEFDEGCQIIPFPTGFTFPFDGVAIDSVVATTNASISTFPGTFYSDSTYYAEPFPTDAQYGREHAQFGLLWSDGAISSSHPIRYQFREGPGGRHFIVQWTNYANGWSRGEFDNTFQAVFWESGAVDYRYGSMGDDGYESAIGWQDRSRSMGRNLNDDLDSVPGGLANRSWRWFERDQPKVGSHTFTVNRTTIFTLCTTTAAGRQCKRKTVTVQ